MARYPTKGNIRGPEGMAALALVRALANQLVANGILRPKDLEYAIEAALRDLPQGNNENIASAQEILREFP